MLRQLKTWSLRVSLTSGEECNMEEHTNKRDFPEGQASQLARVGPDNLFQGHEWRCQMIKAGCRVQSKAGCSW